MVKIFIGLFMIALALFDRRALKNRDSWWAWTNVWARGHRDALGDEGHEQLANVKSILLICAGGLYRGHGLQCPENLRPRIVG